MWDNWINKVNELKEIHDRMEELGRLRGLRIWILHVLDDGPKNGVEIMDAIQEHHEAMHRMRHARYTDNKHYDNHLRKAMKHATRRPSPGSVYPMLKKMVSEGLIDKLEDGRYELTEKGQEISRKIFGRFHGSSWKNMDRGAQAVENALREIDGYVSYLEDIKKEKLIPHEERIGELSERLRKIEESLKEEEFQVNIN